MLQFKERDELLKHQSTAKKRGQSIGFVPTMGALHPGHISLIAAAKKDNDVVICSIFINPTQFNNAKDFEKYPVTTEKDIQLLEAAGCEILFLPDKQEIYPETDHSPLHYELGHLENILEGFYRPGHFQGVCMVVDRLLQLVQPDKVYIGQKDYQQCMVLKKLVEILDLKIEMIVCPTLRETDGLAMSSRNMRLNDAERQKAVFIYDTLCFIKKEIRPGNVDDLIERARYNLVEEGFRVDYIEIANAQNLDIVHEWYGTTPLVALIAVFLNEVRLIDNLLL